MIFIYLFLILFCLYWNFDYKKYYKSSYKKTTGYSYFKVRFDKGFYSEYLNHNKLDKEKENKDS